MDADENVIQLPQPEMLRRGVERAESQIMDARDPPGIGVPFYRIDTLRRMELRGTITKTMRAAGEQFRTDFSLGQFVGIKAADVMRVPGCGTAKQVMTERMIDAKDRVWDALFMLGGLTSPSGRVAWDVLGCQINLEEWAERGGWKNNPMKPHTAAGILIGTLGALEAYYEKLQNQRRRG